jgi:DNA-binding transcriptional LysR family regulator
MAALMSIETRQLRYVVLTADLQSFARAARTLNLKQSTLSRSISDLEYRLRIKLFERSSRGAVLTDIGKNFIGIARRIVRDIDNLQTTARAVSYGVEGRFALGFSSSLMAGNLRMTIAEFMQRHPDMQFDATEAGLDELQVRLEAQVVDALIVPAMSSDEELKSRRLWSERLMVAFSDEHKLLDSADLHWVDLRNEVFVLPSQGIGPAIAAILSAKLAANGYRPNIITQDTTLESVLSTVSLGRYLTIATEASMGVIWSDLTFREIADQGGPARIDYSLYWREDNENPALKQFFKLINERYPA